MLLISCANGNVLFRITPNLKADQLLVRCMNDETTIVVTRTTDQQYVAGLQQIAAKAVALRGSIQHIVELSEFV